MFFECGLFKKKKKGGGGQVPRGEQLKALHVQEPLTNTILIHNQAQPTLKEVKATLATALLLLEMTQTH